MDNDMPEKKSNNVQESRLNGKFIATYQHCGIKEHARKNCLKKN
jgi:hypothetical protein